MKKIPSERAFGFFIMGAMASGIFFPPLAVLVVPVIFLVLILFSE